MNYRDPRLQGTAGAIGIVITAFSGGWFAAQGDWASAAVMAMFGAIILYELIGGLWKKPS